MYNDYLIPPEAYKYIYIIVLGILCLGSFNKLTPYSYQGLVAKPAQSSTQTIWLFFIVTLFIGFRPISATFPDMTGYAASYEYLSQHNYKDLGFWWFAGVCKKLGCSTSMWFAIVSVVYYGAFLISARLLSKNYTTNIYLTILVAFSAFAYAVSGIRNGMGMSLLTLGMAMLLTQQGKWRYLSVGLFICAYFVHASCVIPLVCFLAAYYKVGFKESMFFWGSSVIISVVAGSQISNLFIGFGFDERLDGYLTDVDYAGFSHSGFRLDFLLYSIMPIAFGYYALIKKGVHNRTYEILLTTYVLANAFWIMVIRAQFSDRFAYLSWFLYPIVIAYPLFNVDIWGTNQGRKARNILLLHFAFTFFMNIVYYTIIKTVLS